MTESSLSDLFQRRISAGLLRVHSRKLAGAKLQDCLGDAYDVYASVFADAGKPLTDDLLAEGIPAMVFRAAVEHKWVRYPLRRPRGRAIVGSFLQGGFNPARDEVVPQTELTEIFGGYKVSKGYGAAFKRRFESRLAHWRAEALLRKSGDSPGAEAGNLAPMVDTGEGAGQRAAIGAFISKVNEAGRKITRKDIWTVAGYKNRTEFERFQRGDERTTRAAANSFNRVLKMTPEDFIRALEKKRASN